jgi:hypothetical protein
MAMKISKETKEVMKAARAASMLAQREARALGLIVRLIVNGIIYDKHPDGTMLEIGALPKRPLPKVKKGMIFKLSNEQT